MNAPTPNPARPNGPRAWPVLLLALPAFVAIWSGWVELGRLTGFGNVKPLPGIWDRATIDTAITLPVGVETYAAYALHVWLTAGTTDQARRFARVSAIGSLILGAAGQVAYHLMSAAGMVRAPWPITALVACLPVAVLGMGAALAHLVAEVPPVTPSEPADTTDAPVETEADPVQGDQLASWTENEIRDRAARISASRPVGPDTTGAVKAVRRAPARNNGDRARALRDKHPDWTVARIAERVGVTERTARRHLNTTTPATDSDATGDNSDPAAFAA